MRATARRYRVSLRTVQRWFHRCRGQRLDRVDLRDRPSGPVSPPSRTKLATERNILKIRSWLKNRSPLGEYGAAAIHREMTTRGLAPPCVRTIGRVLKRRGALDGRRRLRYPAPPKGWYLPGAQQGSVEVDCCDFIEDLRIRRGALLDAFTVISQHGCLVDAWPTNRVTVAFVQNRLAERWRRHGLPGYVQFDNDTVFQGNHKPGCVGSVIRTALRYGVVPVFAPAMEQGFQNSIERFNGSFRRSVWERFHHRSINELQERTLAFVEAHQRAHALTLERSTRRPMPDQPCAAATRVIFIRRTDSQGRAEIFQHRLLVSVRWCNRLVRAEADLVNRTVSFYQLRRAAPSQQPLLAVRTLPVLFYEHPH